MTSNPSQVVVMATSVNRVSSNRGQYPSKYRGGAIKLPSTSRFFDSESNLKINKLRNKMEKIYWDCVKEEVVKDSIWNKIDHKWNDYDF